MKIQNLAVIFIIIILPISLILTSYVQNQVKTLSLQTSYDTKLNNCTYDALKAFQLNAANSATSDLTNSKLRDIQASVNTFFNSLASNFNMNGYNNDVLKEYVPALVYTMYDGYYIYSPFTNTLTDTQVNSLSTYTNGEKISDLQPYVYYSCRYKPNSSSDFVITYSLDNYITIQGIINNKGVNDAGYLLSNVSNNGNTATYRGVTITSETQLKEYIDGTGIQYSYIKINGVKHYYNDNYNNDGQYWFTLLNGTKVKSGDKYKNENNNCGLKYYQESADFTNRVFNTYGLTNLKTTDAVDTNGEFGDYKIFAIDDNTSIEDENSNFNQHRLAVIKYSIEKYLSIAIANYNNYTGVTANFQMPKLQEDEWEKILNKISIISFLQGLNIGGKVYNGYSIITNNKNEEVVSEDSIYITTTNDNTYHRATDNDLIENTNLGIGVYNIDFERKSITNNDGQTVYFFPKTQLGCYSSIVNQTGVNNSDSIYEYLKNKQSLAKIYYTALGRERYSMYRIHNNSDELNQAYMQ